MTLDGSTGIDVSAGTTAGVFWSFEPDVGLVDSFLSEQRDLSAVERFAQFHEHANEPLQGRYYSTLLPAGSRQAPGNSSRSRLTSTGVRAARRASRPAITSTGWTKASRGATSAL